MSFLYKQSQSIVVPNITITVNGVVHNYGSFGELFADTETMEQVSNIIP